MSESSLFQEIEEDLQRQKMEALWKRYGNAIIAAACAVVLVTAAIQGWKTYRTHEEQKTTAGFIEIVAKPAEDSAKQVEALALFARDHGAMGPAALARLEAAALALKNGNGAKAIELYDEMANDGQTELFFRQLATLLSVQAQMDKGDPTQLQSRLQTLSDSVWRYAADENTAHLALKRGDRSHARALFEKLTQDAGTPSGIAQRANDMLRWLDSGK